MAVIEINIVPVNRQQLALTLQEAAVSSSLVPWRQQIVIVLMMIQHLSPRGDHLPRQPSRLTLG